MSALRDAYERRLARQLGSPRMSTMERCTQREWAAERASGYQTPLTKKLGDVYRFFCTKAPPFYRGSELRIKDPQNTYDLLQYLVPSFLW